ncbi:Dihydrofolate reductase [Penicillium alfredii]|uniref:Dihydrofolate reductase n=1 Tax=Penicillium alfredii TaxID=1506179 RepID=A0A9W9GA05_9EURO|nr:Dihydrofolate reductase [Penicillium alfredii]KAJ5114732.1 Dihydrofolate reductase [Penicillium alfredii]
MAPNPSATRKPLKLLMLHGYTQSGPLFHAKSRALIKHIQKAFPHHEVAAIYPTGPRRLNPSDIPGYEPSTDTHEQADAIEAYGWWQRSNTADPPLYQGLDDGLAAVAHVLADEGPFDGVIGFSQGAALAAMVAALLEGEGGGSGAGAGTAAPGVPFPSSFSPAALLHPPLKFALCYSGFRAPGARYRAFYEDPPIQTPVLHVLGSLDAVVEEARSRSLIDACVGDPEKDGRVVWHPGGHFLPSQRPYLDAAVRFIREQVERGDSGNDFKPKNEEEDVRDMDVPF